MLKEKKAEHMPGLYSKKEKRIDMLSIRIYYPCLERILFVESLID